MSKPKVGIVACHNTKQDLYCPAVMCLNSLRNSIEGFAEYKAKGGAELVGIVTCDGCPTLAAPDRILKRVKGLVDLGVEAIHLSSCMVASCPYRNKYASLIGEAYPGVKVVMGTHFDPGLSPEQAAKGFQAMVHPMLAAMPEKTMSDVALELYPDIFGKRADA